MLNWIDPVDCQKARHYLQQGNTLQAAKILLDSPFRNHKTSVKLLAQIQRRLVELARSALDRTDLPLATELIECAGRCGNLAPEESVLQRQIHERANQHAQQQAWRNARIRQAAQWGEDGRLVSALGLLSPIDEQAADQMRNDLMYAQEMLQRYIHEFDDYLKDKKWSAAEVVLAKARKLAPNQPQVASMDQSLREAQLAAGVQPSLRWNDKTEVQAPLMDRSKEDWPSREEEKPEMPMSFVLSGFPLMGETLVLRRPVLVVGNYREPTADIRIQGRVRRRHAVIVREPLGGQPDQYRLIALAECPVEVNGMPVTDSRILQDGDLLQFGGDQCAWYFRRSRASVNVAILSQSRSAGSSALAPDGSIVRCLVLMEDQLTIGSDLEGADVADSSLPMTQLNLDFCRGELRIKAVGGVIFHGESGEEVLEDSSITIPFRMSLHNASTGPQMFGAAFCGRNTPSELRLDLR